MREATEMNNLQEALARLDLHQLEQLAGNTIVRAVRGAYETNRERELSRLVLDKYGDRILTNKEIRFAIIDILDLEEAERACSRLRINLNNGSPHSALQSRYKTGFTRVRAEEFVHLFNLPARLIPCEQPDTRQSYIEISPTFGMTLVSKGVLHPYQRRLKDKIRENLESGIGKMMAQMPTGAGKTVTALEVLVDYLRQPHHDKLIVWIVNSNELADQALKAFNDLWLLRGDRPTRAYRFFGGYFIPFGTCPAGVVFASFQTASSWRNSDELAKKEVFKALCQRCELVIVDEAHSSIASTFEEVVRSLTQYGSVLIGLSATPGRNDPYQNLELSRLYGDELTSITDHDGERIEDPIKYLQDQGYLAKIVFEELQSGTEIEEYNEETICKRLAEDYDRNKKIITQIERAIAEDQSTLVFACGVDHVIALSALCTARNIKSGFIIGEVNSPERLSLLNEFKMGALKVLINYDILSAGVDLPNVDKLIITRPIGSPILYSQVLGRALRGPKNGGNLQNYVVTIVDNLRNYADASRVYASFANNF